jgi:hypothetical protein
VGPRDCAGRLEDFAAITMAWVGSLGSPCLRIHSSNQVGWSWPVLTLHPGALHPSWDSLSSTCDQCWVPQAQLGTQEGLDSDHPYLFLTEMPVKFETQVWWSLG